MSDYKIEIITDREVWENFVLSRNPQSFLQSWNWGETNILTGKVIYRLGIFAESVLVGVSLIIKEEAKRGPHFLIPGGPLINWNDKNLVIFFIREIKNMAIREGVWFIRLRPELLDTEENQKVMKNLKFIPSPMHLHAENTWILNIKEDENVLLSGMRKTTRYLIRKSLKMNLIFEATSNPHKSFILKKLQDETVQRHKFVGFSQKLFRAQLLSFGKFDQAKLYLVKLNKEYLAAAIIIFYGKYAYYHHSGSVGGYKDVPFSYFLQWKIILEAKKRGLEYYNFWGISPNEDTGHRFAGVTMFKKGFGGRRVDWLHAHDLPISKLYWLTYLFENIRKSIRHL